MFNHLSLDQLRTRARLNAARGIAISKALRDEIARREAADISPRKEAFGQSPLWIVTRATKNSELADILFHATPKGLATQVRGGLDPDEIIGWFEHYSDANQYALQELHRAGVDTSQPMTPPAPYRRDR